MHMVSWGVPAVGLAQLGTCLNLVRHFVGKSLIKGSDDGVLHIVLLSFWTTPIM
jgi:hypothetical protein